MGESMETYDDSEKIAKIIKYGKWVVLIIIILVVFLIIKSCSFSYSKVEKALVNEAKKYINDNRISISGETFIEATNFDIVEGTELCTKSTGVIVKNENGKLKYQAYLDCPDYKSNIIRNPEKYIKLIGDNVIVLNKGELYEEPGYENLKGADIEEIKGDTATNIYDITYKAYIEDELKEIATRKIIVSSNDKMQTITNLSNTEEPVIILKGDKSITITLNSPYIEPGYVAYDYKDGKISREVTIEGKVDVKKVGNYNLVYSITNSKEKTAVAVREINVVKEKANLEIELSYNKNISNKIIINGEIRGEGFSHVVLPNGAIINNNIFTYDATSNKSYVFQIFDKYGNKTVKEIEISEIDSQPPVGSCVADYRTKSVTVTVNVKDNKGIKDYEYLVGSTKEKTNSSEFVKAGEFNKDNATKVQVNVQDIAGNIAKLTCDTVLNLVPSMYRDSLGYDCLEPYTCYKQRDYSDPYQATINGVGTIYRSGCLPTSLTIISTKFNKRSKSGELYTPPTLIKEIIYPDGVIKGYSNYERAVEVANALNLKISEKYSINKDTGILLENLKNGNPALMLVTKGCLAAGAHFMAILGINDKNQVFVSDPNSKKDKSVVGTCPVNTWVDIETLKKGIASVEYFAVFSE